MGAYLAQPKTEKVSEDDQQGQFQYGVSGMQGWRMSMEDAHCCLPDFDGKTNALFGVFDGHGGKEVAEYCAQNFHKFLLENESYQDGKVENALKETFMEIDEAITSPEVIKVLEALGGLTENEVAEEEDEAAMLLEEANMPLDELLEKFKGNIKDKLTKNGILFETGDDDEIEEEESVKKQDRGDEKEPQVNGMNGHDDDTSKTDNLSRSRKQKKPVKRTVEEVESSVSSSKTEASSTSSTAESGSAGNSSSTAGPSSNETALVESNDDPDFDGEEQEEEGDANDEDEEDGEDDDDEESESEEEFEDSEGMEFQQGSDEVGKDSGTTAIVALVHNQKLYVANVGDSRCVLCRGGKAMEMSLDHKPEDEIEMNRIERAGGKITKDGRVNGGLNLSRAIGDHTYKQNKDLPAEEQVITAYPDIKTMDLGQDDDFMVLACDGIWNIMSSDEVIEFVKERLHNESEEKVKLSKICEELFDHCLAPNTENDGSGCDNMTCLIIRFKHSTDDDKTATSQKRTLDSDVDREGKKARLSSMD